MKVYGGTTHVDGLSDVHFLKLRLSGQDGHTISENLYWRGIHRADFTALNRLPKVKLKVSSKSIRQGDKQLLMAKITNPALSCRCFRELGTSQKFKNRRENFAGHYERQLFHLIERRNPGKSG